MNSIKLEWFAQNHPSQEFPPFKELTLDEERLIEASIANRFEIVYDPTPGYLFPKLLKLSQFLVEYDPFLDSFRPSVVLAAENIQPSGEVALLWDGPSDVMLFDDLDRYFHDIWEDDDLLIVDDGLAWAMFVDHPGDVFFLRIPPNRE